MGNDYSTKRDRPEDYLDLGEEHVSRIFALLGEIEANLDEIWEKVGKLDELERGLDSMPGIESRLLSGGWGFSHPGPGDPGEPLPNVPLPVRRYNKEEEK